MTGGLAHEIKNPLSTIGLNADLLAEGINDAEMLRRLGFARVRLLTNNPHKVAGLERHGIEVVERVPHAFPPSAHNQRYLATKAGRGGHLL